MLYLEHKPAPPLNLAVRSLWYARDCDAPGGQQLVLPTGRAQLVIGLSREFLLNCAGDGPPQPEAAAQIMGARSIYERIDASDLKDLIGVVFHPGGFPLLSREAADQFTNRGIDMEAVWGADARRLREQLRQTPSPGARLICLEAFLLERMAAQPVRGAADRGAMVQYALRRFHVRRRRAATWPAAPAGASGDSPRSSAKKPDWPPQSGAECSAFSRQLHSFTRARRFAGNNWRSTAASTTSPTSPTSSAPSAAWTQAPTWPRPAPGPTMSARQKSKRQQGIS